MKIKLTLLFTILIFFSASNIHAQESYVVNAKTINVRKEASLKGEILGTIPKGEIVTVINSDNPEWWLITYYDNEGYVSSKLLITIEKSTQYHSYKKVEANTGDNYNCENIKPQYDTSIDNELIINVGYNSDAVVKLMNYSGICIRICYIKGGDKYSMRNIPLGDYYLKIAYGKDYRQSIDDNKCIVRFLRDPVYKKGEQNLKFEKTRKGNKVVGDKEYANYDISYFELTLNNEFEKGISKEKTFNSKKISEKDFNK